MPATPTPRTAADAKPMLKPCPFCGSRGELVERPNPLSKWRWSVDCTSSLCGMSGPVGDTWQNASEQWNARSSGETQ